MTDKAVDAVKNLSATLHTLRVTGVIRSRRYTGDLGEWYVERLYGAARATGQTQKGWDIQLASGDRLQVKTQSYDLANRWNYLDSDLDHFDRFVLVILTDDLTVRDLYDVPVHALRPLLRVSLDKGKQRFVYYWDTLAPWLVNPNTLPGYAEMAELFEMPTPLS